MHRLFGTKKPAAPAVPAPTLEDAMGASDKRVDSLDVKVCVAPPVGGAATASHHAHFPRHSSRQAIAAGVGAALAPRRRCSVSAVLVSMRRCGGGVAGAGGPARWALRAGRVCLCGLHSTSRTRSLRLCLRVWRPRCDIR
jgi:hypothetical protein